MAGEDATFHLANAAFLTGLKKQPLLINSCRGEVFDTEAVNQARKSGLISGLVIDCWENEPDLDIELLKMTDYGTPHIAGYSKDGKANGTMMSVQAVSRFFNLGLHNWKPPGVEPSENPVICIDGNQRREYSILAEVILSTYDIENDDIEPRRETLIIGKLRGYYPVRREFDSFTNDAKNLKEETIEKLKKLGFEIRKRD